MVYVQSEAYLRGLAPLFGAAFRGFRTISLPFVLDS
jgi:hypothetical protein